MGERQFGPYRLVRQIAVGGMAEIHLAKTKGIAGFEKYCALKMIHPNFAEDDAFIQMLVDEAKIAVQLSHGNIAQTFDLGRVGDTYYITMEYVDGADLYKILRRASEQDLEMPLDVCAFIAKEVASALDHAHRKRDHVGKPLGIVHRDVSPQNVLVSYAGEVKLVDFGIAKATMKVRQTAVGVIKGKYYYMSPEQAWGDPIDYRSDIFSAGIVLYEMITGQMLYLEEDLHKLLDMARRADIAPPSKLRRGVPPQLERIVMHALAKSSGDRYQSAGDFAADLERFLHTYAPVFTASKIATLVRQVIGDPIEVPDDPGFPSVELRDGVNSTHTLDTADLLHDREDIRDENSVIFRVDELGRPKTGPPPADVKPPPVKQQPPPKPAAAARSATKPPSIVKPSVPKTTRAADPMPARPQPPLAPIAAIAQPKPTPNRPSAPARPRQLDEETRQLANKAPPGPNDEESGLLTPYGKRVSPTAWDASDTHPGDDDLANIGDRTLVTGGGGGGYMMDVAGEDGVEATLITGAPQPDEDTHDTHDEDDEDAPTHDGSGDRVDQVALDVAGAGLGDDDGDGDGDGGIGGDTEGPTLSRGPGRRTARGSGQPPPALAAKIHAPAVSELRKPRASRRTPPGGVPNVLQQIVGAQVSEPMPVPRAPAPTPPRAQAPTLVSGHAGQAGPTEPTMGPTIPRMGALGQQMQQMGQPGQMGQMGQGAQMGQMGQMGPGQMGQGQMGPGQMGQGQMGQGQMGPGQMGQGQVGQYTNDASGLPLGIPTPPSGLPAVPNTPPGGAPYVYPPPGYPQAPQGQYGTYPVSPGGLYPLYGAPRPQPASLTGQMRLLEVDEVPSHYKIGSAPRRWFAYLAAGTLAVSVAAVATFFIIRMVRETTPVTGSVHIESVPSGADVVFDGQRLSNRTPLTVEGIPVGTRHQIRIELAHHKPFVDTIDIPKSGSEIQVKPLLVQLTGKLVVNSQPGGADILINGQLRGRTPTTIHDIDMATAKTIEIKLKDHQPVTQQLDWPSNGQIALDIKLQR